MAAEDQAKLAPSPEALKAELERAREQIVSSAAALREEVAMTTHWRQWVRRRPGLFLAGAVALGFLIGYRR